MRALRFFLACRGVFSYFKWSPRPLTVIPSPVVIYIYIFFWLKDFYIPKFEASQSITHQCWFSVYIIVVIIATITVIRSTAALPPAALEKCGKYHSHSQSCLIRTLKFFCIGLGCRRYARYRSSSIKIC